MDKVDRLGQNDKKERTRLATLFFAIPLIAYVAVILCLWNYLFVYDEGAYALTVTEFSGNPAMVLPTVTGEHPEWKPPLFTWIYSAFYFFLKFLPIPVEAAMRMPSAFFGAGSICLTFLIGEKIYNRKAGIYAAAILFCTPLMIFCAVTAMMEALSVFIVLAAIYAYLNGKLKSGMALLGLLVLTKWLYAIVPAVFLVAYFWKKKEFQSVMLSLLVIPAAFLIYLLLAALFGDFNHALEMGVTYAFRASTDPTGFGKIVSNFFYASYTAFPLYLFFIISLIIMRKNLAQNLPAAAMGAMAMIAPLFSQFIFWYMSPALPGLALFSARAIEGFKGIQREGVLVVVAVCFLMAFLIVGLNFTPDTGIKEVSGFMKGKSVLFVEPGAFATNWVDTTSNYLGTDAERLVLEQRNPGFLFYRFGDSGDYENIDIEFISEMEGSYVPPCREYLVVHEGDRGMDYSYSMEIPECFRFLWRKGDYAVYAGGS